MILKIKSCYDFPCDAEIFTINDVEMDLDDFGFYTKEGCPKDCAGYDCHEKQFNCYSLKEIQKNLEGKIALNKLEIKEVCKKLEEVFDVGDCGWCV